jgi:hypothetical protein
MKVSHPRFGFWLGLAGLALAVVSSGCQSLFAPRYQVLIDAICAPAAEKPTGKSYRVTVKNAANPAPPARVLVVKACVEAALASVGMFESPPNVAPEIFVEVGYGRDAGTRIDAAVRETFIELSARTNPEHRLDRPSGPEIWNVKTAILGAAGAVETAMPLLASVAVNYLGADTGKETSLEVLQNSPAVEAVRVAAQKALEKAATPPAGSPGSAPAPGNTAASQGTTTASTAPVAPSR